MGFSGAYMSKYRPLNEPAGGAVEKICEWVAIQLFIIGSNLQSSLKVSFKPGERGRQD